jgi:D-beta-D-heptose 7-phosphate kinase/D-beta-D-heptose 1-phosphate adenosyltransferase
MKILVIGDACTDVFVYGTCDRLSPEAPTAVLNPVEITKNPGMAGNVEVNLRALGYDPITLSNMKDAVKSFASKPKYEKQEITKTRYVDKNSNYILLRVDENDSVQRAYTIDILNHSLAYGSNSQGLSQFDLVIVADYNKGFLTEELMTYIFENSKCSFLDTKRKIDKWAEAVTYIKINNNEFYAHDHQTFLKSDQMRDKVIITEGSGGCRISNEYRYVNKVDIKDVAGAGDTFMAAVATHFAETDNIWKSMEFANQCAREVVQQKGVVTVKNAVHRS